jgi:PAS domain S-box-containing protein
MRPFAAELQNLHAALPDDPAITELLQRLDAAPDHDYQAKYDALLAIAHHFADEIQQLSTNAEQQTIFYKQPTQSETLEDPLNKSEKLFKNAFEYSPIGMALISPTGQWLRANQSLMKILGYGETELLKLNFQQITHPDDLAQNLAYLKQALNGEITTYSMEKRYFHKDGHIVWVLLSTSLVRDEQNQPLYFVSQLKDITTAKQAEAALRESEQRFKNAFEFSPLGMALVSLEGPFLKVNQRLTEILGYSEAELLALDFQTITYPDDLEPDLRQAERLVAGEIPTYTVEKRYFRKDGGIVWTLLSVSVVRDTSGKALYYVSQIQDITERKQAENDLRESEERFRAVSEMSSDYAFMMTVQPDGNLKRVWITDAFEGVTGFTPQESEARGGWAALAHPEDLPRIITSLKQLLNRECTLETEYRIITKSGQIKFMWGISRSVFDPDTGKISRIYGVAKDITEQKRLESLSREQEKLQVALQKEQELSNLKTKMMSRISHEFRTPLSIINLSSDLLAIYFDRLSPEKRGQHFGRIKLSTQRIIQMLDDISMIIRSQVSSTSVEISIFDLKKACQEIIEQISSLDLQNHRLVLKVDEKPLIVEADRKKIEIILLNLLDNALKYSRAGTTVEIAVAVEENAIIAQIRDEGIGIVDGDRQRIFEPFFRGSNFDETGGLGLGLTIVKHEVDLCEGEINVESAPGEGTTFTVILPHISRKA